jgi:uncharacterized protein YdeI (YjbR/CyaY-like superfamily)
MEPRFFASPQEFREWLAEHHDKADELLVGFYKVGTGKPSMTWPESVDEALCAGWIDGVRRRIDDESYSIRFTPRRASSTWSAINLKRIQELQEEGRVLAMGQKAFELRKEAKTGIYAYEQSEKAELTEQQLRRFQENEEAWNHFRSEAPWYQRNATWWVVSAKRDETKEKRLGVLIDSSANGKRIPHLTPTEVKNKSE